MNSFILGIIFGVSLLLLIFLFMRDFIINKILNHWFTTKGLLNENQKFFVTTKQFNEAICNLSADVNRQMQESISHLQSDLEYMINDILNTYRSDLYHEIVDFVNKELTNMRSDVYEEVHKYVNSMMGNKERK